MENKEYFPLGEWQVEIDVRDGIIAHLTRECGRNVHDHHIVDVACESFERDTKGANPQSGIYEDKPQYVVKNAADLETDSLFHSDCRKKEEDIPHTRNNWVSYYFKKRMIVPTHYAIRTYDYGPGQCHLKSWLVDTSTDGKDWRKVAHEENNKQLNGKWLTGIFKVAGGRECRFIRLVNIGRNHWGSDSIWIYAWEIFGSLTELTADPLSPPARGGGRTVPSTGGSRGHTRAPSPSPGRVHLGGTMGLDDPLLPPHTSGFAWFLRCRCANDFGHLL
jgi:hypothetical protein